MSRTDRQKDKYGNSKELPCNASNEGTAARTRPFSFEEIMLRRKNKKLTEDAKESVGELGRLSRKEHGESASDHSGSDGGQEPKKDSVLGVTRHVSRDSDKGISRKKEENKSTKEDGFMKDKVGLDSEAKLKVKSSKDRSKSEKDKGDKNEKQSHYRGRNDDRTRPDFENESEKKQSKDMVVKDKNRERNKTSHRESKRKQLGRNDEEKISEGDVIASKRHDSGKWQDTDYSERKGRRKESSQSHYEETRQKRRRSRSWEHDKDRDRSISISPRGHKRLSNQGRDHGQSSFRSFKDRSGRQHSDADKNRMSSSGGHASGHYRRYGGHTSGLGGYSPRKRRTEAAIRTPSPTNRSPERKSAAWDLAPDDVGAGSVITSFRSSRQAVSSSTHELSAAATAALTTEKSQNAASTVTVSTVKDISFDSIQLTQATRPMRRLYVENLPATASDKAVMECLNDFLLSSGVNHIQGTQPCISCMMNKEKGQALVEFLTPEHASSALSFDGRSFAGSILKIRRPKDFVEAATGVTEKPVATVITSISDVVKDTPQKIFIGGIPKALPSDMLMEIVTVFGPLKAYRFEANEEFGEPSAFLEYVDHSVTLKACAGLNGIKLGGNVLTVVQAVPDASEEGTTETPHFYGIPEHAKPLLEKPTQVLKLKNVFDQEEFSMISEPELEETLEDIRLECARFGTVKSVNIVRFNKDNMIAPDALDISNDSNIQSVSQDPETDNVRSTLMEHLNSDTKENGEAKPQNAVEEPQDLREVEEASKVGDDKPMHDDLENEECGGAGKVDSEVTAEEPLQLGTTEDRPACSDEVSDSQIGDSGSGTSSVPDDPKPEQADGELQDACVELEMDTTTVEKSYDGNGDSTEKVCNPDVFEKGCILVEYMRREAACAAAHCLHGRLYGGRVVAAEYAPYDLYHARFPK
ncbi:splicing factor U2af large subunit A [Magnolia sinica]|uniref:splicing factor U2af large subunit A n=1 Tax=Magnolia sinica TaxID=86752 RepID=UPI0026586AC9|nr:splicing factor U2af large subunit A [Magnolia sinica]XP_058101497.1 splicing factor U2af large subunit A [Magnolia sinica]XP_058101498.1 splicing factor U2af large subunit A [Magnolia sinica]